MFDTHFRTLFLSTPAKLSLKDKNLIIQKVSDSSHSQNNFQNQESHAKSDKISIPLSDILCLIIESHQITLTSALLNALAMQKIVLFSCDSSHLPSGLFMPFLGHYRGLKVLQSQIALNTQRKAILWQQIIKAKLKNQSMLLSMLDSPKARQLLELSKSVYLGDSYNYEAQGAQIYFPALFGAGFVRRTEFDEEHNAINSALNYGYAIVRGIVARGLCASGLNPLLGINHKNTLNSFNLADDLMEPYRIFVDSVVLDLHMAGNLRESLELDSRLRLAEILSAKVLMSDKKFYPLYRAVIASVQSFGKALDSKCNLCVPIFNGENSNGREIYESASDV